MGSSKEYGRDCWVLGPPGELESLDLSLPLATTWRAVQRMRKTVGCRDGLDGVGWGGKQDRGTQAGTVEFTRGPRPAFRVRKD